MSKTVIVFPSMGPSTFAEVGKFMTINKFARRRVAEADEALGYRVLERFRAESDSGYTELSQVAFFINSVALADWAISELDITPDVLVGPSVGERALAVHSGSLSFADGARLTADMARVEAEFFATEYQDVISQFVVRTPEERLHEILVAMSARGDWHDVSGYFDTNVHLISMRAESLDWFKEQVRAVGGYNLTTMKPPAHSQVLTGLRDRYVAEVFPRYTFADPTRTSVSDQDGTLVATGEQMRDMLLDSVVNMVHWGKASQTLVSLDVARVCVAGPDFLVHRLDCIKQHEVLTATPKEAMKPRRSTRR